MKIFKTNDESWSEKVNFVDDNNVLVGFDMGTCCCESFGWFLSKDEPTKTEEEDEGAIDVDGFQFDVSFFKEITPDEESWDQGGMAIFRLTKGEEEIFLALHNSHNGHYSHGFKMEVGGTVIVDYLL